MDLGAIRDYLARNWYKVALAILLLFIILKKDLSLQLRLQAPAGEPAEQPHRPPEREQARRPERERLSESAPPTPAPEPPPQEEMLDFSGIDRSSDRSTRPDRIAESTKRAFRQRFAHVAVSERKKFGIPASLVMGHAFLLSQAGQSELARTGNNFFALPCTADWQGPRRQEGKSCFRRYDKAWTSFRDHSLFLTSGRLAHLRRFPDDDYRGWARALEKAGFYPQRGMARQVIDFIEAERLYELDR
jgi:flagellum-specific peptidoglycan hydrolase FlgJ